LDKIPQGVRAVVAQRLHLLSEDCQQLLAAASVIGREFTSDVLARAEHVDREPVTRTLEAALAAKLLTSTPGSPGRFRFAHEIVREVLYDELPLNRRMRLHRAVAEALKAIHAPELDRRLGALAHHFFLAGTVAEAVEYATRAAERAMAELAYE